VNQRTKHIDVRYQFIKDLIKQKKIDIQFCPTEEMIADVFTKPLGPILFSKLKTQLGLIPFRKQTVAKQGGDPSSQQQGGVLRISAAEHDTQTQRLERNPTGPSRDIPGTVPGSMDNYWTSREASRDSHVSDEITWKTQRNLPWNSMDYH
jgi:hypothetical protein